MDKFNAVIELESLKKQLDDTLLNSEDKHILNRLIDKVDSSESQNELQSLYEFTRGTLLEMIKFHKRK